MEPRDLLAVMVVCSLLAVPLTTLPGTTGHDPADRDTVTVEELKDHLYGPDPAETATVDREVRVVLELADQGNVPASEGLDIGRVYTAEGTRHVEASVPVGTVRALANDPSVQSVRFADPQDVADDLVAPGVSVVGADALHDEDVVGENVTVGVIDSGFRVGHPSVVGSVGSYRSFDDDSSDDWRHGTAVASVVADTAPGATLHLASIGDTTTEAEYRAAVEWLEEAGADVIVDAGSYYGQPGDGTGSIAHVAAEAANETVFVTSAGNHAERYWRGNHTPDDPEWVEFDDDVDGNYLNGGEPIEGTVSLTLRWDEWPETETDYDIYLLRERIGARDVPVATATGHDGRPFEHLQTTVPEGRYYVAIRGDGVESSSTLELFGNHELYHWTTGGQSAPATAPGVVTVGASADGALQPYSVRDGVDVVAPDTVGAERLDVEGGTSFAAPYVAGVAALLVGEHPDLRPEEVRALLAENATAIETDDGEYDFGRVNATASFGAVAA
ncbi:S8 family peptidase [Halomarina ordinaria]|uniref:S8 family serine peptidase n=1 Tax=Halomarina ordinaria TaxID=3033939 RepID=A0ABD5UB53_9EURY|nr:S8 family serine peptidase [Halomarina sp. PSRA2]